MPYEINLQHPIDGIALSYSEAGEQADVLLTGFLTDSQGEDFYYFLQQIQNLFLKPWKEKNLPLSIIDNCLILIENKTAIVYINETNIIYKTISKSSTEKGQSVTLENIIGVISVEFPEIYVPNDNSIIYLFSIGWKRGVYFDFRPNSGSNLVGFEYMLGIYYEMLLYSHIYQYDQSTWDVLFKLGWFPFISILGIGDQLLKHLLGRLKDKKSVELVENRLIALFDSDLLEQIMNRVKNNNKMMQHQTIINTGIERYIANDYISCINNIYPRIEGILRYIYFDLKKEKPNQRRIVDNIYDVITNDTLSPGVFFPEMFKKYLLEVYFKNFNLQTGDLEISRHSIGHGVSESNQYTKKNALLGILMIDQLAFYLYRIVDNLPPDNS